MTMHALRRPDASMKAYRSMEYRMYSSFMSTLKEMQQDTYTQQHHLQQQPAHHVQTAAPSAAAGSSGKPQRRVEAGESSCGGANVQCSP